MRVNQTKSAVISTIECNPKVSGAFCAAVLCAILCAGLWPFWAPKNDVEWLKSGGLAFGRHGSVVSAGPLQAEERSGDSGTLEVQLRSTHSRSSSTILSFYESAHPGEPFSMHQVGDSLVIRRNNVDANGVSRTALFTVDALFQKQNGSIVVGVTLNARGMSVYVNGALVQAFPLSGTWNDLTGRIVLANSPTANDSWAGEITRLAIYRHELTASQMASDHTSWLADQKRMPPLDQSAVAFYLFDEHEGKVAHNSLDATTDLFIPTRYFVLHPEVMRTPWREYHQTWSYWKDILVNIGGFIPFGFCICVFLTSMQRIIHPATLTIVLGLLTSLTIEVLQAFLPTRSSGMTDLITNTLGTAIGVLICRTVIGRGLPRGARKVVATGVLQG
jgi:VanZ family protein